MEQARRLLKIAKRFFVLASFPIDDANTVKRICIAATVSRPFFQKVDSPLVVLKRLLRLTEPSVNITDVTKRKCFASSMARHLPQT